MINAPENGLERIIYVRPNVGVKDERDVGYLKGSLLEKIWPLAAPVLDNLITFMSEGDAKAAIENEHIIPTVVSLIRGRSFRNSLIIVDEAQNISINGLKAVLTRVAENSKVVVIGDLGQADLGELSAPNGLADALHRFVGLDDVAITRFEPEDIQRHAIIQHVLSRY
jgi:phosphate starvation-inducible PhoH-like protein